MDDDILVAPATTVDAELLEAMRRLVAQLAPAASPPGADALREIVTSGSTTLLVARDRSLDSRVVGCLTLAMFRIPTAVRAWVEDVIVEAGARGKGVGEALTREALRLAHERGALTVELTSRPSREAANRLYQRLGFRARDTNVYRFSWPVDENAGS